ncbi:MAG TPA: chromosome segregation protein SMC [Candidatus Hydrogenedens sp.]|nr:chromosome segregation protein SMC [Candidatus Hydrogenedens sp.]
MYLKQIELIGFKSFAEKTALSFNPGITVIVGPNGCGKSNILDAIRWVLGEQSTRELRTMQMAEVIFNGSENRSALGMAEATITFDNHDGKLPVDFNEIQITRKVYRTGDGEYFINKSPCRLKDITELFMDTGVGTDSYSIIGQGKIDLIISTHPEDRRYLFEEVAGIVKYKSRRKIAVRKLESAEQNLLRLQDVIAEVERQLRSLKRQAQIAQRYRNLTQKLKEFEVRNAWFLFNTLQEKIHDLRHELNEKKKNYHEKVNLQTKLETEEEQNYLKRSEIEKLLSEKREQFHNLETNLEHLESQLGLHQRELEYLSLRKKETEQEKQHLSFRLQEIKNEIVQLEQKKIELSNQIKELGNTLESTKKEEEKQLKQIQQTELELTKKQQFLIDHINSKNQIQSRIQILQSQQQSIQKHIAEIQETIQTHEKTRNDLEQQKQQLDMEIQKKQVHIKELIKKTEQVQFELSETEKRIQQAEQKHQQLRERISRIEARLHSLNELRERYEGFASGVRAVMNAKNEGLLGGEHILGPIGDLIRTERGYELAIESALGGNINNIVVQTADSAKIAIAFLKEHWAGRVTFLPLDTLRPSTTPSYPELDPHPGVIGPAIDFVHVDTPIIPALQYLLYNTYLVQTIDDAIQIARTYQQYPKLVTMEGEIINQSGAVTGGRTKQEARGLLTRVSEIEELEQQQATTNQHIQETAEHIKQYNEQLELLKQQIRALQNEQNNWSLQIQQIQIERARLVAQQEQISNLITQLSASINDLENEASKINAEVAKTDQEAHLIIKDDTQLKSEIDQQQQELNQYRNGLERIRQRITNLLVHATELTSQLQEVDNNLARLAQETSNVETTSDESSKQTQNLTNEIKLVQEKIADTRAKLTQLSETRQVAQQELVQIQEQYQNHIQNFEQVSRTIKDLHAELQKNQEELHQLELELSQINQQAQFLRQRILEEYQLELDMLSSTDVGSDEWDETEREQQIEQIRQQIQRLGTVNPMAVEEYEEQSKRYEFLISQQKDLNQAREKLQEVIRRIDETVLIMFTQTFKEVGEHFKEFFRRLFNGGHARIYLIDENDPLESGIEIEARPPGKKPQSIHQLSGGEQALTAIALLFAIFKTKPSPFCILDEVDAPLDDTNISRFLEIVKEFTHSSQFIIITHNKQTMACADAIIGITQQERGVSEIVSIKLKELVEATS